MAWKVNRNRPKTDRIEVRRSNFLQVYRAYKEVSRDRFLPLLSSVGLMMIAFGFGAFAFEAIRKGSR
jgi:hypothetical protein